MKEDQTQILKERGYWKSYNRAYYSDIFKLSGAQKMVEKYGGDWFTYDKTPRSVIIDRDYKNITDMDTFMAFMRYLSIFLVRFHFFLACLNRLFQAVATKFRENIGYFL